MRQINLYRCSRRKQRQCKHNNTCTYPVNAKQTIIITPFKNNNNGKKPVPGGKPRPDLVHKVFIYFFNVVFKLILCSSLGEETLFNYVVFSMLMSLPWCPFQ